MLAPMAKKITAPPIYIFLISNSALHNRLLFLYAATLGIQKTLLVLEHVLDHRDLSTSVTVTKGFLGLEL